MTATKLKPCPFCGGEAELVESDYGMYITGYAVYCKHCCTKVGVTGRLGEAYEWIPIYNTEAEAISAWNHRTERTCRFIDDSDGEFPPKCSACGYEPSIYECSWLSDGGYEFEGNYCQNCGAKVVDE